MKRDSCEEALAVVRDAHWQALAAGALLEDKIGRLSHSLSCGCWCSGSCRHLGNHWQRSQNASCQIRVPQVASPQGEPTRRQAQFPSPGQLRWWVTFEHSPEKDARFAEPNLPTWRDNRGGGDQFDWLKTEEEDLNCPPPLEPHILEFLMGRDKTPMAGIGVRNGLQQTFMSEPSPQRSAKWIKWCAQQIVMPA